MSASLPLLANLLLLDHIHDLIRHPQALDIVPTHVTLRESEEFVAVGGRLHDFFEGDVHVGVAGDEVAVEGFAGFEFDEHGVALGCGEEAEGELGCGQLEVEVEDNGWEGVEGVVVVGWRVMGWLVGLPL